MPIGTELSSTERGLHVRVWAPTHSRVTLVIEAPEPREIILGDDEDGYHSVFAPGLGAGTRYRFRLGASRELVCDPTSRFQPDGPFGASEVIDPATFPWTDAAWRGIEAHRHVLYELHLGSFTPEGTWAAAAEHLPYLADVGITTLEIMPINEFAGGHNWGYDGVNLFAPTHNYGRPDDMRRFVDRAHACGVAVILDVVYNHFGPSGNQMYTWSPHYRSATTTEWGDAINFDGDHAGGARELMIENAAYWIREFHLDGLRIDATQAFHDTSPEHVLTAIARRAREAAGDRTIFLVGENEPQDTRLLRDGGLDALWNDDFHHTARIAATGAIDGYLSDYRGSPQELISAIKRGFLYQGQLYPWQKQHRGTSTRGLPRTRFVHFLENHDQVANLGFGERLATLADPATLRALTALLLLSPELPMLFHGQEMGSTAPWLFFVDHCEELHQPVRRGRAEFLTQFARLATAEAQAALPDPCEPATFSACTLDPRERRLDARPVMLHRDLLRLRREHAAFTDGRADALDGAVLGERTFLLRYLQDRPEDEHLLLINLGASFQQAAIPEPLIAPPPGMRWAMRWSSEDPRYGGHGTPPPLSKAGLAIPARAAVLLAPEPAASTDQERTEP